MRETRGEKMRNSIFAKEDKGKRKKKGRRGKEWRKQNVKMGRKQVNESEKYSLRGKMVSGREGQSKLGS